MTDRLFTSQESVNENLLAHLELLQNQHKIVFKKEFPVNQFIKAPASKKYHGNYPGGLYEHSLTVTQSLMKLTDKLNLTWEREASPLIVGLFHDLCKIDAYEELPVLKDDPAAYKHSSAPVIDGHGEKSIIYLQQYIDLTEEEIACIRWHMGAYERDTSKWEYYDRAIRKYPNVLYTHTADMIASKIIDI